MRVFRLLAIIIIVVFSMPTTAAAHLSQNIRQGPQPVFAISRPGEAHVKSDGQQRQALFSSDFVSEPLFMLDDALGSTIALTNHSGNVLARMNYDAWGNLWWPRKQAYHTPPCQKNKLANFLDRFRGHILGKAQHDPWRLGYHYAKVLTPYLYTGRKFDTTTQTYFHRNRYYNPQIGRFSSSDPIGFNGGYNLYSYANQNPVRWVDPWGLEPWSTGQNKWSWNEWFHHPTTSDQDRVCGEGVYPQPFFFYWITAARTATTGAAKRGFNYARYGARQISDWWKGQSGQNNQPYTPYAPKSEFPKGPNGQRIPSTKNPHTQLGTKQGRHGPYPAGREFGPEGEWVRDIHFTDHGPRPVPGHVNPHQHPAIPNPTGGTPQFGPPTPFTW